MKKVTLFLLTFLVAWSSLQAQSQAGKEDSLCHSTSRAFSKKPGNNNLSNECNTSNGSISLSGKEKMKAETVQLQQRPIILTNSRRTARMRIYLGKAFNRSGKEQMKAEVMKLHTCSVHPLTALDKNDICPKCSRTRAVEELEKRLNIKG